MFWLKKRQPKPGIYGENSDTMNRSITNTIRFFLDECIPPFIRDSRWFMYPFFYIWFKGKNIAFYMDFKSRVYKLSDEEFINAYRNLDCLGTDRPCDLNQASINFMLKNLEEGARTLLDVGCGRGHWLNVVASKTALKVTGCDLHDAVALTSAAYVKGNIEALPFPDQSFDIVTCHHTLEHLKDLPAAIAELKRVARQQIIIVVPCQRYYYYTMDMHINFFPIKAYLQELMKMEKNVCQNVWGDWVFIGQCG